MIIIMMIIAIITRGDLKMLLEPLYTLAIFTSLIKLNID